MVSLDTLPVELVLKILRDLSLEDILNVTRTSTFFRSVGYSSRSLWANAQDASRLPLPMGETLDTVSLSSMTQLAASAIALSKVWRAPVAHPRRISHTIQYLSGRHGFFVVNHSSSHGTFLPGNKWLLIDIHTNTPRVYCLETHEFLPLVGIEGTVISYAYESPNNGSKVILAVLRISWRHQAHDVARSIDIYILQFDAKRGSRTLPCVNKAVSICIPSSKSASTIDLKGSLVVVSVDNELFIANWQERSGVNLSPYLYRPPEEEQSEEEFFGTMFRLRAYFHPDLPLLMVEKLERSGTSIHVISHSAPLTPFECADLADKSLIWPTALLTSTRIHTLAPQQVLQYRSFRRHAIGPALTLDVISAVHGLPDLYHLSISDLEAHTPETSSRSVEPKGYVLERPTSRGGWVCLGIRDNGSGNLSHSLLFLRMPDERYSGEPSWVRLKLPDDVQMKEIGGAGVLAFDDVYGTLLLDDAVGNYRIVQY